jgi:ribosomal protein S18 acetylase RimI-like enzyme
VRTVNEPTEDDLLYIGSWLCASDRKELALTRDPDDYYLLAHDAWISPYKRVVLDEGMPVLAFGASQIIGDTAAVWGFKTERGRSSLRLVTKYIHRTMIPALRSLGVRHAVCLVHPENTASQRWLQHLGFALKATLPDIGAGHEEVFLFRRDELDA